MLSDRGSVHPANDSGAMIANSKQAVRVHNRRMPPKLQVPSLVVGPVKEIPILHQNESCSCWEVNRWHSPRDRLVVSWHGVMGTSQTALNVSFRPENLRWRLQRTTASRPYPQTLTTFAGTSFGSASALATCTPERRLRQSCAFDS